MASLRKPRPRADGSVAHSVLYTHKGQQTSATFDTAKDAEEFRDAVNTIGAERANRAWGVNPTKVAAKRSTAPTVSDWLARYIESRTGVSKATIFDYNSYLKLDLTPMLGAVPIDILTANDVAEWVNWMAQRPSGKKDDDGKPLTLSGKTIANRHGFLSAALNIAVKEGLIPSNPAAGTRLPRTERKEMTYLTTEELRTFVECFTPHWRPLVKFLATSGARIGEVAALKPSDVNRKARTVHIGKGRKRTYDEHRYEVGPTKTKKSDRLITLSPGVLDVLDYTGATLFTNTVGKPIEKDSFRNNVWYPAVARAQKAGLEKRPRIHDMRHTCASLMIAGGANMYAVQRHLGHESIQTTINLYSHLDRKDAEAAADIIGKIFD